MRGGYQGGLGSLYEEEIWTQAGTEERPRHTAGRRWASAAKEGGLGRKPPRRHLGLGLPASRAVTAGSLSPEPPGLSHWLRHFQQVSTGREDGGPPKKAGKERGSLCQRLCFVGPTGRGRIRSEKLDTSCCLSQAGLVGCFVLVISAREVSDGQQKQIQVQAYFKGFLDFPCHLHT